MEEFHESIDTIKFKMSTHLNNVTLIDQRLIINKERSSVLETLIQELDEAKNILTILKNYKMETKKEFILDTINTALHDVFSQNLRVDIDATSATSTGKINMKYDIVLYQNDIEMARNEKLLGNNGGGVLSFISILFKILVGYIYSDNKFFLFDESISQVSPLYRPRLAQFLNKFCEQYGFTLVLISQTDDIDEHANLGYILEGEFDKDGVPELKIQKIFGEYPTDKYTYVKIENFQSIVKQEFRYKGFTVIRGNNNIGKSASFRAINSLLFNTFDANDHPRKKRARGADTRILFGFEDSEATEDKKIGLVYKSGKVIYEFNDLQFAGKSLAFDKVKEKVESIGFKYVDLKETYKNFKGNLKEQTERLAMTTQYDGFFLVGNKTSETDKVFNFLFDSTDVANAIAACIIDINNCNTEFNMLESLIKKDELDVIKEKIFYDIYILKFYNYMINDYFINAKKYNQLTNLSDHIKDIIQSTDKIIGIDDGINKIIHYSQALNFLKSNNLLVRYNLIGEIISQSNVQEKLNQFIENMKSLQIFKNEKIRTTVNVVNVGNILNNLDEIYRYQYYVEAFKNYEDTLNNMILLKNSNLSKQHIIILDVIKSTLFIESLDKNIAKLSNDLVFLYDAKNKRDSIIPQELSQLDSTYGISVCSCCNGTGYTILN